MRACGAERGAVARRRCPTSGAALGPPAQSPQAARRTGARARTGSRGASRPLSSRCGSGAPPPAGALLQRWGWGCRTPAGGRRAPRFLPRRGGGVARSARAQAGNLSCDNCAVSGRCVLQMNYWGSTFSAGSATWRVSRSSSDWLVAWHTLRAGSTLASIVSYGSGHLWISFLSRTGATARGASMAYEFSARGGTGTLSSKASAPTPFRRSRGEELQTSRARAGSLERTPTKMGIHFSYHRDERP